jgi:RNA polymerase sigma-70 factor (ECF subfamily)
MEWVTTSTILDYLGDFRSEEAWSQLTARFRAPIISFAMKLGLPPPDAEDVAQETLLAFAEAYHSGGYDRSKGRLSHWLFGIAYRQAAQARRKLARREARVARHSDQCSFWSSIPAEKEASISWDAEWERAIFARCLEQVRQEVEPTTYRAFRMLVLEERGPEETASTLGLTRNAVFIAKHRVLKRLRRLQLEFEDITGK